MGLSFGPIVLGMFFLSGLRCLIVFDQIGVQVARYWHILISGIVTVPLVAALVWLDEHGFRTFSRIKRLIEKAAGGAGGLEG